MVVLMGKLNLHELNSLAFNRYSRKILWFHLTPTNHDPGVINHYFITCVEQSGGIVTICRMNNNYSTF